MRPRGKSNLIQINVDASSISYSVNVYFKEIIGWILKASSNSIHTWCKLNRLHSESKCTICSVRTEELRASILNLFNNHSRHQVMSSQCSNDRCNTSAHSKVYSKMYSGLNGNTNTFHIVAWFLRYNLVETMGSQSTIILSFRFPGGNDRAATPYFLSDQSKASTQIHSFQPNIMFERNSSA